MVKTTATIFAALLLACTAASADTIPLQESDCSGDHFCYNVDDAGTTLYANSGYGGIVEVFLADGNYYLGRGPVGLSITSYPVYLQPAQNGAPQGDPAVIWVTATWITWTTKGGGSGRGGYASHQHWALTGGEFVK